MHAVPETHLIILFLFNLIYYSNFFNVLLLMAVARGEDEYQALACLDWSEINNLGRYF